MTETHERDIKRDDLSVSQEIYEIRVKGQLDEGWAVWFEGMEVSVDAPKDDGPPTTTIAGPVLDQAALYGLLGRIRDLGLSLVSVNRISELEV